MEIEKMLSNVNGLQGVTLKKPEQPEEVKETKMDFWDAVENLNDTQKVGQQKMSDIMTGKSDDTHGALIAVEKASLYTEIATSVRDKAVYGFNKLMDMQI